MTGAPDVSTCVRGSIAPGTLLAALALSAMFPFSMSMAAPGTEKNAGCGADRYKLVPLPLRAVSVNDSGLVAGMTEKHRAALWTRSAGLREVPLPTGFSNTEAVAVNKSGLLVGMAFDRTFTKHQAFTFTAGHLAWLPGDQTQANGINASGEIVGEALLPGKNRTDPVYWSNAKLHVLDTCCGGSAKAVNKNGEIIGDTYDDKGRYHAFLWNSAGDKQPIGPADHYSSSIAVSDQGHAVSMAFPRIYFFAGGNLAQLALSPKFPNHPRAMNGCDVIVGSFGPFSDKDRAFVWDKNAGFRDLNDLIPTDPDWVLQAAMSINDRGEIVGFGEYKGDDDSGFLLVPQP
jgi:probable HAF family extracellular repeat protein